MIRRVLEKFWNKKEEPKNTENTVFEEIEEMFNSLDENGVRILIGEDLKKFTDNIGEEIKTLRSDIKDECGFILPPINIKFEESLQENEYKITVNGNIVFYDFIIPTEENCRIEINKGLKTSFKNNLQEFFTNEITERYACVVQKNNGWLAWNVTGSLSITSLKTILIDLLEHKQSINNIINIFEKINEEIYSNSTPAWIRDPHEISQKILQNF